MTPSPRGNGRGGAIRSSRTACLVVHPDPEIREAWARALEAAGMRVTRCVGPVVSCILDRGGVRCPLVDDVDLAIYHEPVLTERFVARLSATRPRAMVIAARDRHRANGDHEPAFVRVIPSGF